MGPISGRLRRPSHATVIAYLALFIALGGVGYAATHLPAGSVGTKQLKNKAVTLGKISSSARRSLKGAKGATGPRGASCPATNSACRGLPGLPGPSAAVIHIDTTSPFTNVTLATLGPWKIEASCVNNGSTTTLSVRAVGPSDSVADGIDTASLPSTYSSDGATMPVGNDASAANNTIAYKADDLTLYSPTGGSAHVSMFKYEQGPSVTGGFRCKVSGTGYVAH